MSQVSRLYPKLADAIAATWTLTSEGKHETDRSNWSSRLLKYRLGFHVRAVRRGPIHGQGS
jgi:hypothetical protein